MYASTIWRALARPLCIQSWRVATSTSSTFTLDRPSAILSRSLSTPPLRAGDDVGAADIRAAQRVGGEVSWNRRRWACIVPCREDGRDRGGCAMFEGFTLTTIDTGEATIRLRHGGSGPPLL